MPCITAARLLARSTHPGPALLAGLLDDDAPAPGLDPHPTEWQIDLDRPMTTSTGATAFPACLTVGWGPGHTPPWEAPLLLAETTHACRLVVAGGHARIERAF